MSGIQIQKNICTLKLLHVRILAATHQNYPLAPGHGVKMNQRSWPMKKHQTGNIETKNIENILLIYKSLVSFSF